MVGWKLKHVTCALVGLLKLGQRHRDPELPEQYRSARPEVSHGETVGELAKKIVWVGCERL